jgi:hypothetical protein
MWLLEVWVSVGFGRTGKQRVAETDVRYIQLSDRARSGKTLVGPRPFSHQPTKPLHPTALVHVWTSGLTCIPVLDVFANDLIP